MSIILPPNPWRQQPTDVPLVSPTERQAGLKEVILPYRPRSLIGQVARAVTGTVLDDVTVGGRGRKFGDNSAARDLFAGAWSRTSQFTAVVVGRLNSVPGGTRRLCGNFTSVTSGFTFSPTASNHRLILSSSSANFTITDSASIAVGEFILVARYNGTQGHMYSAGKSTGTPVTLTYATGSTDFRIGNDSSVNATPATVQAFAYYDRALSDQEIYDKFRSKEAFYSSIFVPQEPISVLQSVAGGTAYTLTADSGAFALTGTDATLAVGHVLTVDSGAFALTGTDATLAVGHVLAADSGDFALTGADATLEYTPAGGPTYTLTADSGAFALTGTAATLAVGHVLTADSGSIVLTGADATLVYTPAGSSTLTAADLAAIDALIVARIPDIAAAVLAAAVIDPIHSDFRKAIGQAYHGDGSENDKLRSTLIP